MELSSETVRTLPSFREAYRKRRCILPVDGFFEWKAIKGQKAKQPYAIAMKNGSPFGIGGGQLHLANSSSNTFASFRSSVSKPSGNQPQTGARRSRASPSCPIAPERAMFIAART